MLPFSLLTLFSLLNRLWKFATGENFVWRQLMPKLLSFVVCLYFNFDFAYSAFLFRLIGLTMDAFLVMIDSVDYLITTNKLKEGHKTYLDVILMHIFYRILLKSDVKGWIVYVIDCCLTNYPIIALILECCIIPFAYNWIMKKLVYAFWPKVRKVVFTIVPKVWYYLTEYLAEAHNKVIVPSTKKVVSNVKEMFITIEQACAKVKAAQIKKCVDSVHPDWETYELLNKIISVGGIFENGKIPKNFKSYINDSVSLTQCCMTIRDENSFGFVKNGSIMLNPVDKPIESNIAFSSVVAVDNKTIAHVLPVVNNRCYMLKGKPTATSGYIRPSNVSRGKNQRPLNKKTLKCVKYVYNRSNTAIPHIEVFVDLKTGKPLNVADIIFNDEYKIIKVTPAPYPNMTKDEYLEYLKDYKHSGYYYSSGFNPSAVENVKVSVPLKKSYNTVSTSEIKDATVIKCSEPAYNVSLLNQNVSERPQRVVRPPVQTNAPVVVDTKPVIDNKPVVVEACPKPIKAKAKSSSVSCSESNVRKYTYDSDYSYIFDSDFEYVDTLKSKKGKLLLLMKFELDYSDEAAIAEIAEALEDYGKHVLNLHHIEYIDHNTGRKVSLTANYTDTMYCLVCCPGSNEQKLLDEHRHHDHKYESVIMSTKMPKAADSEFDGWNESEEAEPTATTVASSESENLEWSLD